ncbi:MAG: peptide deformylase [Oscillospiraceae bacterium]|nr:peptide deformylase [Oscillospiraceae bacterium]
MALRTILTEGEPSLNKVSRKVEKFDARLHELLDDMHETLALAEGVGLAAPQVGVLRRAVLVDNGETVLELINPEILEQDGEQDGLEGCLSIPGQYGLVKRPMHVKVRAQDRNGNWYEAEGEGLTARCFCHEIEHLDGILYRSRAYRMLTAEELEELRQSEEEEEEEQA